MVFAPSRLVEILAPRPSTGCLLAGTEVAIVRAVNDSPLLSLEIVGRCLMFVAGIVRGIEDSADASDHGSRVLLDAGIL